MNVFKVELFSFVACCGRAEFVLYKGKYRIVPV